MSVYTLAAAKSRLGVTDLAWDSQIQTCIDSAEATLSALCGLLSPPAQVTETITVGVLSAYPTGRTAYAVLSTRPVVSLTSVTPAGGQAIAGAVIRGSTVAIPGGFINSLPYAFVYQAGRSVVSADLLEAVGDLAAHLFSTRYRGGPRRSTVAPVEVPVGGYLIPNAVAAAISPYLLPGFA